eukprot:TRINITY_DN21081_c0_g1_i1.p1 TRINITY_DN21081_c0_g1~~TRINITY_DN21081_c0_g1_i1.p1  ORF type:complete len:577 (+),score=130.22 TRINITY_DN21081_c0_g1_i1:40-1731(+)
MKYAGLKVQSTVLTPPPFELLDKLASLRISKKNEEMKQATKQETFEQQRTQLINALRGEYHKLLYLQQQLVDSGAREVSLEQQRLMVTKRTTPFLTLDNDVIYKNTPFKITFCCPVGWMQQHSISDQTLADAISDVMVRRESEPTKDILFCKHCNHTKKVIEVKALTPKRSSRGSFQPNIPKAIRLNDEFERYTFEDCRSNCSSSRVHHEGNLFLVIKLPGFSKTIRSPEFSIMLRSPKDKKEEETTISSDMEGNPKDFSAANYPDWKELETMPSREEEYKKFNSKIPHNFATVLSYAGHFRDCHGRPIDGNCERLQLFREPGILSVSSKTNGDFICFFAFFENPSSADRSMIKQLQILRNEAPNPNLYKKNIAQPRPPEGAHFFSFDPFFKRSKFQLPPTSPPRTISFSNVASEEKKEDLNEKTALPVKHEIFIPHWHSPTPLSSLPLSSPSPLAEKRDFIQQTNFSHNIDPIQMSQMNQMNAMPHFIPQFNQLPSQCSPKILGIQEFGELGSSHFDSENDLFSPPRTRMRVECESDMPESEIQIESELRDVGLNEILGWRI